MCSNQNIAMKVSPQCPPDMIFRKYEISAFTGKKINIRRRLDHFLQNFEVSGFTPAYGNAQYNHFQHVKVLIFTFIGLLLPEWVRTHPLFLDASFIGFYKVSAV